MPNPVEGLLEVYEDLAEVCIGGGKSITPQKVSNSAKSLPTQSTTNAVQESVDKLWTFVVYCASYFHSEKPAHFQIFPTHSNQLRRTMTTSAAQLWRDALV